MIPRIALLLPLLCSALPLAARDPIPQVALWDMARLGKTPEAEWGKKTELIQEVLFRGEPFEGKPTQVFAYIGRPEGTGPFPGIVLVHGGGGQAFKDWANHWAKRGYVAIAMDTAGNGVDKKRLENGSPDQSDEYKFGNFEESGIRER